MRVLTSMFARWFLLYFLLICVGCGTVVSKHLRTFQDAQSAFDAEDYPLSISLYQRLLEEGIRTGTVYYNLGNAYVKAGDSVRAVAAYYFAKRYIPNDPHLNANLLAVLSENGGTLQPAKSSIIHSLFFWQDSVGYHVKIWSSLLLTISAFLNGMLYLFRQSRWIKRSLTVLAILSAIAFASVGYDWYRFEGVEQAIVMKDAVPRKGNSEQYEPAFVAPMPFGTLAVILDERSGWYLMRFPSGQEGWLPQSQTFKIQ